MNEARISDLTEDQKGHLAWRLDHKTYVGYLTALRIVRGEFGNDLITRVFEKADMTAHQAKIHARKVVNFRLGTTRPIRNQ